LNFLGRHICEMCYYLRIYRKSVGKQWGWIGGGEVSVDLLTRLIRHSRGGMMLLAHQRSRGSAAFAKAGCTRDLAITKRNRCGGRQPTPTHERDRGGGRNARATSSRLHAFPICPPAIHPRESPAAAGPAAIIRRNYSQPSSIKQLGYRQHLKFENRLRLVRPQGL
jgi:hypothetical protein